MATSFVWHALFTVNHDFYCLPSGSWSEPFVKGRYGGGEDLYGGGEDFGPMVLPKFESAR
jgi:hypothetical protein